MVAGCEGEGLSCDLPVASTSAMLLDRGRVSVSEARFGEVARETIFGDGSTVGEAGVVAIVGLVATGHVYIAC